MRSMLKGIGAAFFLFAASILISSVGHSASLRVAPTTIELIAPDSASTINLRNEAKRPLNVQIRVFRWVQENGAERLEPTTDVVASPPAAKLAPNADYVVRVVRVSKAAVRSEESYRLVVDELPDPSRRKAGTVALVVRHVIPVFFRNPDASSPDVSWSISRSGRGFVLAARNGGSSRLRISDVSIMQGGQKVAGQKGLLGYVLGGATMRWPMGAKGLSGRSATLRAESDFGPFDAPVTVTSQ